MRKKVISVLAVLALVLFTTWGTTVSATEKGLWFVFTSFGEIESVELNNLDTGVTIVLHEEDLFDYETVDFVTTDTKNISMTKKYLDGTVIEQAFNVEGASFLVGIYDDGTCGESWMEIDEKYVY